MEVVAFVVDLVLAFAVFGDFAIFRRYMDGLVIWWMVLHQTKEGKGNSEWLMVVINSGGMN